MTDQSIPKPDTPKVRFHYIKSNFFRVVHVDGALGGVTPQGYIHCAVYSERPAIPLVTEHEMVAGSGNLGTLGPAGLVEGKVGFVRELDVDLIMSRQKAVELRDWLTARINELDELQKGVESTEATP